VIMGGNFSGVKPEEGRYDANSGLIMYPGKNNKGDMTVPPLQAGLDFDGEVRQIALANGANGRKILIVAKNNDHPEFYEYNR